MALQSNLTTLTMLAAADYSTNQFHFVVVDSAGRALLVSSAGGDAVGILQNKPDAIDKPGTVAVFGRSKVMIGVGDLVAGNKVQSDAAGEAIVAASADHVLGVCLVGGSAGEIGEVLLGVSNHILA